MTGLRWAKNVLDNVLLLLGLVALTAGVAAGGLLLHEPGWFLGVFGGLLMLVVFGEGAYRTWDETDKRPPSAAAIAQPTVADRMEGFARELDLLTQEVGVEPVGVGEQWARITAANEVNNSFNDIQRRVRSDLRRNAPEFMAQWRSHPPGVPWPPDMTDPDIARRLIEASAAQARDIADKWRRAHA